MWTNHSGRTKGNVQLFWSEWFSVTSKFDKYFATCSWPSNEANINELLWLSVVRELIIFGQTSCNLFTISMCPFFAAIWKQLKELTLSVKSTSRFLQIMSFNFSSWFLDAALNKFVTAGQFLGLSRPSTSPKISMVRCISFPDVFGRSSKWLQSLSVLIRLLLNSQVVRSP